MYSTQRSAAIGAVLGCLFTVVATLMLALVLSPASGATRNHGTPPTWHAPAVYPSITPDPSTGPSPTPTPCGGYHTPDANR